MTKIDPSSILAMRSNILQQNSALQKVAKTNGAADPLSGPGAVNETDFGAALKGALGKVNDLQSKSSAISESYGRGETTDIAAVMLARQQASIGFQATVQVRNKLVSSYQDMMNMQL